MPDLFVLPPHVLRDAELRRQHKRRGHAAQPGTGPAGERCGSCRFLKGNALGRVYYKCGHAQAPQRTNGAATDIKLHDPACERWEAKP